MVLQQPYDRSFVALTSPSPSFWVVSHAMPRGKKQAVLKRMHVAMAAKRAREREGRQLQEAANHSGSDSESELSDAPLSP